MLGLGHIGQSAQVTTLFLIDGHLQVVFSILCCLASYHPKYINLMMESNVGISSTISFIITHSVSFSCWDELNNCATNVSSIMPLPSIEQTMNDSFEFENPLKVHAT